MFKLLFVTACVVLAASAAPEPKPGVVAAAYTVPAAVPLATSSQYIARNYNGLVYSAPLVASAPVVASARYVASPFSPYAYSAPYVAAAPAVHYV
ncbi:cuticle protein 16.5-like [Cloeon dipterum]|uniref:cuticle protein 16.5-like n=1 Tax=Cloeon dipterum TaxID=197152 RepID=UPI00321FC71D